MKKILAVAIAVMNLVGYSNLGWSETDDQSMGIQTSVNSLFGLVPGGDVDLGAIDPGYDTGVGSFTMYVTTNHDLTWDINLYGPALTHTDGVTTMPLYYAWPTNFGGDSQPPNGYGIFASVPATASSVYTSIGTENIAINKPLTMQFKGTAAGNAKEGSYSTTIHVQLVDSYI